MGSTSGGWIGVDLDGTLAQHGEDWDGISIGEPVPKMVQRVRTWLKAGKDVRIMTARVSAPFADAYAQVLAIDAWCEKHLGTKLRVTCAKDYQMIELWDDRAVQVVKNMGERLDGRE